MKILQLNSTTWQVTSFQTGVMIYMSSKEACIDFCLARGYAYTVHSIEDQRNG